MKLANYSYRKTPRLEDGCDYRFEIKSVEEKTSKSGNNMLVVKLAPNGFDLTLDHYIVQNERWDENMTRFCSAFGIEEEDTNPMTWPGAIGAARVKEDSFGFKIAFFISPKRAETLPPWVGPIPERQTVTDGWKEVSEDEKLPWED